MSTLKFCETSLSVMSLFHHVNQYYDCSLTDSFNSTYISVRVSEAIVAKLTEPLPWK